MLKPILVAVGASSILAHGSDMRIAPKYYICNESTGFCEMQPLTAPGTTPHQGTTQEKCLLTCQGTIWPAPTEIQQMVTGSTSDFCDISFSKEGMYGSEPYETRSMNNFLESLSLVQQSDVCDAANAIVLTIVMRKTVRYVD